jgi:hypothetical protein
MEIYTKTLESIDFYAKNTNLTALVLNAFNHNTNI